MCGLGLLAGGASADLQGKIDSKRSQLSDARDAQAGLSASIEAQNQQIDAMIGEISALQQQASAARAELAAEQAKLDRAKAKLAREKRRLEIVKARLRRALLVLQRQLVAMYKSDSPDTLSVVMQSASWADVVAQSDYLDSLQNYGEVAAARAKELRNQVKAAVRRMREVRDQIQASRDAIAAKTQRIEMAQSQAQARHDELVSLRSARQAQLDKVEGQAQALSDNLSSLEDQQAAAAAATGSITGSAPVRPPVPGQTAQLNSDGTASPPAGAPAAVKSAIEAANQIANTPYVWGGGHGSFTSSGYDCSGSVSYMLNGGGFLSSPLDSTGLETWGSPGSGQWITVYANSGHTWAYVAGLYFDTVGAAPSRWHTSQQSSTSGFIARHPSGY